MRRRGARLISAIRPPRIAQALEFYDAVLGPCGQQKVMDVGRGQVRGTAWNRVALRPSRPVAHRRSTAAPRASP